MSRLFTHTDSQTERSFHLQLFQCHFKLQLLANQQAPCLLTSRSSQFPPAAESFSLSFFFKLKWRLVSCLKEHIAFPAGVQMLTCNKAGSRMVVDAANSNGPFQPVALLHIRGELLCVSLKRNLLRLVNKWPLCFR